MINATGKVGRLSRKGVIAIIAFILILIVAAAVYFMVMSYLKSRLDNTPTKQSQSESTANVNRTQTNATKSNTANTATSNNSRYKGYKDNTGWITDAVTNSWSDIYNKDGYDAYVEQIKQDFTKNGQTFDINNPYDGRLVGKVQ